MNQAKLRRAVLLGAVLAAVIAAATATWRTVVSRPETAETIATQLRCPACQGETVARSPSPMAAAMREVIAAQLADGRSPDQVRQWFVDRYGASVLADPPATGWGLLLWLVPAAAAIVAASAIGRRVRPGRRRDGRAPPTRVVRAPPTRVVTAGPTRARRTWNAVAVAVVALAAAVALASPARAPTPPDDPIAEALSLASSLEEQERFAEAADVYRDLAERRPDREVRLRLAYCLLRSDQSAEAAAIAGGVVTGEPADAEALLLLGLAQRAQGLPDSTATLQRFLTLHPDHEAAPQVRRLLESEPS